MRLRYLSWVGVLCLGSGAAFGGALGPGLMLRGVVLPPTVIEGVRSIKVEPFKGTGGAEISREAVAALKDPERVVGRAARAQAADAMVGAAGQMAGSMVASKVGGLGGKFVSGLTEGAVNRAADEIKDPVLTLDDGLRIDVFKVVEGAADAVLSGSVTVKDSLSDTKKKEEAKDSKGNTIKDDKGQTVYIEIPCKRRSVTASVHWTLRAKGGDNLAEETVEHSNADERCGPDIGKVASAEILAKAAVAGAGRELVGQFAPAWDQVRIDLDRNKALSESLKQARKGEVFPALCGVRNMLHYTPDDTDALYILGGLHEGLGWFDEARVHYERAIEVGHHKGATKARDRVVERQQEIARLEAAYGLKWKIGAADYSACPEVPEGRPVTAKKDVNLTAELGGGDVVAEVEKGTRLYVVAEEGGALQVSTADGARGWVSASSVK